MMLPTTVLTGTVQRLMPLILAAAVVQTSTGARAVTIKTAYVDQTATPNSNANWPAVNGTYNQNFGIAFQTGSTSASYTIDWIDIGLNTSGQTASSASLTVALHQASNSTAYSAVAAPTAYATDRVTFTKPITPSTQFALELTSAQLPNITGYAMSPNTAYALILYAPDINIGLMRATGHARDTTNNFYAVSNGFVMLDTFRGNSANYKNNATSFPSLDIAFGAFESPPAPVPAPLGVAGVAAMASSAHRLRRLSRRLRAPL